MPPKSATTKPTTGGKTTATAAAVKAPAGKAPATKAPATKTPKEKKLEKRVKRRKSERRPTRATSTKFWNRSIPTLASQIKPCPSSTRLSTTFLNVSPGRLPNSQHTTSGPPSLQGKFKRRYVWYCPANWLSTPCQKGRKPWRNTRAPSNLDRWMDEFFDGVNRREEREYYL